VVNVAQFTMHHEAGDLSWPPGMVDECDMDVDLDITAEVNHTDRRVACPVVSKSLNFCPTFLTPFHVSNEITADMHGHAMTLSCSCCVGLLLT